jgi:hypothetical protein
VKCGGILGAQDGIAVDFTPLLLNSAGCIVLFQNFVVLWKIHILKYNSTSRRVSSRRVEWYTGCLCKFLRHMGATTGLKKNLKLLKIPKTKKTDEAIVIQACDWAQNTS